ncbi:MAG: hypothetical protein DGJ47_000596 [Rickettsiaceae bacterium]
MVQSKFKIKNFIISAITVLIQYYNYHLFGFLAANIAGTFFHHTDKASQLLSTYLIMSVAMIGKPLGAILLGNIGDRMGRAASFKLSLVGTAVASLAIAIIPSYNYVGIMASVLLLLSRLLICSFVSAGSDGVRLYIYENISDAKRCLAVAMTALFTQSGSLCASLSAYFFTLDYLPDYFWRLAFLLGGFLSIINYFCLEKNDLCDANKIKRLEKFHHFQGLSLRKIVCSYPLLFILCVLLAGSIGSTNQFLVIFFSTYSFEILNIVERSDMYQYVSVALISYMFCGLIGGYLADKIGYYRILSVGVVGALLCSNMLIFQLNSFAFSPLLYVFLAISLSWIAIPAVVIYKQSIPQEIRYRLFALSHSVGSICISAPTAYISTYIYIKTKIPGYPILYLISVVIMILLTTLFLQNGKIYDNQNSIK